MAILTNTNTSGMAYDINRDMYYSERDRYEKEMHYRRMEEEHRRALQNAYYNSPPSQVVNQAPKPDTKDPLAFLQNTDKKLLLTGEMQ